ncbi:TPA: hypothetical protein RQJ86_000173 [Vibrio vulnificus]|nr:hypothetical protein [Vibrio vulnificus]HDY7640488.1 hypothetical protein [Vibrio vulnificus]
MHNAFGVFKENIQQTKAISDLYNYLTTQLGQNGHMADDLLRAQMVYAVSAFDKLMHDLIRIGLMEIFEGKRPETAKYSNEPIQMQFVNAIKNATIPPPEYYFEQAMIQKLKVMSFQDPNKVVDGLAFIWDESQKWQKIAAELQCDDKSLKTDLKLIVERRNKIVHEADINALDGSKLSIDTESSGKAISLLENLGTVIFNLVKLS